ncbi:diaminobutyrate acetyltransferase [Pseudonocardia sp. CNS-004]|nr:diaminobutyrate acetyltransferase [Pseudonocardia sp. CNS-004]
MAAPAGSPDRARPNIGEQVTIGHPDVTDGVACWRLAEATGTLDVNSRYAYLLWCRDFAATSVVARRDGEVVGFVTGFRRPEEPSTLVVWQVAVDAAARGRGVAAAMLDALFDRVADVDHLEATVTPDNTGSIALFSRFAARRGAQLSRSELFGAELLGSGHEPEILFRIGPVHR